MCGDFRHVPGWWKSPPAPKSEQRKTNMLRFGCQIGSAIPTMALVTAISLLCELIGFPTHNPGGDELALCLHLERLLRDRGADSTEVVEVPRTPRPGGYVFAQYGSPRTIINIHLDTVPPNHGWQQDPFAAKQEKERVYGLGAADTKGAIAALLAALDTVRPKNLGILFSGDEERSTTCVQHFLRSPQMAGIRQAIVCEPTNRRAGISHRGISAYQAKFLGQGGHSSQADTLPKPVTALAGLAGRLDALGKRYYDASGAQKTGVCMNISELTGGVAFNVVPQHATLTWSVRPCPQTDWEILDQEMRTAVAELGSSASVQTLIHHPPFQCRLPQQFAHQFGNWVHEFVDLDFWTEAAMFAQAGINAIVIGPGNIEQAHAANEYVSFDDLDWAVDLFQHILAKHT